MVEILKTIYLIWVCYYKFYKFLYKGCVLYCKYCNTTFSNNVLITKNKNAGKMGIFYLYGSSLYFVNTTFSSNEIQLNYQEQCGCFYISESNIMISYSLFLNNQVKLLLKN